MAREGVERVADRGERRNRLWCGKLSHPESDDDDSESLSPCCCCGSSSISFTHSSAIGGGDETDLSEAKLVRRDASFMPRTHGTNESAVSGLLSLAGFSSPGRPKLAVRFFSEG